MHLKWSSDTSKFGAWTFWSYGLFVYLHFIEFSGIISTRSVECSRRLDGILCPVMSMLTSSATAKKYYRNMYHGSQSYRRHLKLFVWDSPRSYTECDTDDKATSSYSIDRFKSYSGINILKTTAPAWNAVCNSWVWKSKPIISWFSDNRCPNTVGAIIIPWTRHM